MLGPVLDWADSSIWGITWPLVNPGGIVLLTTTRWYWRFSRSALPTSALMERRSRVSTEPLTVGVGAQIIVMLLRSTASRIDEAVWYPSRPSWATLVLSRS